MSTHRLPNVCQMSAQLFEGTGHEVLPFFTAITMEYRDMKDFKKVLHFGQEALVVKVGVILESIFNLISSLKKMDEITSNNFSLFECLKFVFFVPAQKICYYTIFQKCEVFTKAKQEQK